VHRMRCASIVPRDRRRRLGRRSGTCRGYRVRRRGRSSRLAWRLGCIDVPGSGCPNVRTFIAWPEQIACGKQKRRGGDGAQSDLVREFHCSEAEGAEQR
jgi:hypothetical protein